MPLTAQSESRPVSGRSAWFACTSIPDSVQNPVKLLRGTKLSELKLSRYMASAPVKIPADGIIRIVREEGGNPDGSTNLGFEQGPLKHLVLAQVKIPDNMREALIILVPLEKPKDDLIFAADVQDLAAFKGGDQLFINLSKTHIRVKLGDTGVPVAPGRSKLYEAPNLAKPTNMAVRYDVYDPAEEKWKLFSASTVVLRPSRRKITIFNSGTRPGNIKKHGILFPVPVKEP